MHPCINLGSYNYLGFSDDWRVTCQNAVVGVLDRFGVSMCASAAEGGYTTLHRHLERTVAEFVGKPDAITFSMGYGTNATALPALLGKGTLVISDSLNHTSIVNGARASGATIRVFKHDDTRSLEGILQSALVEGQPRTGSPWRKIVVVVEGVYSMEGEMVNLPAIVAIAKRYKAYIYLDEAHSIGAVGATGRGVCEHFGVDPADIDVMMGTFTKSFGAMGGYIAANKSFIDYLRHGSSGSVYSQHMAPSVAAQVLRSFDIIMGRDGSSVGATKLQAIKDNANYFRQRLIDMGCDVYGHVDSPVIPVMLFDPCKIIATSRELFDRGVAAVVVGFPATPLLLARVRFCISSGHTRESLDCALEMIQQTVDKCWLAYRKGEKHKRPLSHLPQKNAEIQLLDPPLKTKL